ncbi:Mobile element protein (plasmid) [Sinorhizobium fredii CCBAU 83666]|nr:Mobile element protein [Sinorhizobium fredii CCBAU 83666]
MGGALACQAAARLHRQESRRRAERRHARSNFHTTQIGGAQFTNFRTTPSKSRLNFLSLLRGNDQDYALNDAAFDYLDRRRVDPALVAKIRSHEPRRFCNQVPFLEYLANKGIDIFPHSRPSRRSDVYEIPVA